MIRTAVEVDQAGRWDPPEGRQEMEQRLNVHAYNPWYGLFPPAWWGGIFGQLLDPRCNSVGKLSFIGEVIWELRILGAMCVMACGELWRGACALWCNGEAGATRVATRAYGLMACGALACNREAWATRVAIRAQRRTVGSHGGLIPAVRLVALADSAGPQWHMRSRDEWQIAGNGPRQRRLG